ncbi:beta-galactosidase [Enterococcus sp. JM4C]|uniref:glycoside hydrolase family 2 protein n=1 Tax=Candidatus Enterococcus huntleyi TaxID=1857217 RepID=UPI00137B120F|nr:glycoside hydrolase family 2 protein [Enterococcus sp. JM4C]KAF1299074.1 beta-galactosidase [Enterococcus sp. JM4C]
MRNIENKNSDWFFYKGEQTITQVNEHYSEWENIDLPHTWNAIDGNNGFDYYRGVGWYVKEVHFSEMERNNQQFIEFLGANSVTELYVNNQYVGQHKGGYATFRFDITEYLTFGATNLIQVKVDNAEYQEVYPLRADFTFYGGIYRDVNLISVNPLHIDLEDFGSSGVYIQQEEVTKELAELTIKTRLKNKTNTSHKVRVWYEILNTQDQLVTYGAQEVLFDETQEGTSIAFDLAIKNPHLWNGKRDPYLYSLHIKLQQFNDTIDEVRIPFGVRYFSVDPEEGFYLNGESLRLNGVSRHQDKMTKGWAISKEDQRQDMELIKEIGATSIRLAHYQHDGYFYDLCDQAGMIVWAEIPFITEVSKSDTPQENAEQQLIELIRQNFNHPAICFWGVQNEIQIDHVSDKTAREIVKNLIEIAKKEDPTRLTTMANVLTVSDTDEYNYLTDIIGYNKYYGWYMGKAEDFAGWIDGYHETNPQTALAISEYGAEGIVEYHNDHPQVNDYSEEYHALFHEKVWSIFSKRKFLWATYVWNMFDFGANVRDEGGVKGRNNKGLVTFDRKIKKDAFYMYKAHWSDQPFIHIASKRYVERASQTINLVIYTNCQEVEVFLNDQSVGTYQAENKKVTIPDIQLNGEHNQFSVQALNQSETIQDTAYFHQVSEPFKAYELEDDRAGENVENWFEIPEIDESQPLVEVEITDDVYSSRDSVETLMNNEQTRVCMVETLGDLTQIPMYGMMKNMTLDVLMEMDSEGKNFSKARVNKLNQSLTKIKKV